MKDDTEVKMKGDGALNNIERVNIQGFLSYTVNVSYHELVLFSKVNLTREYVDSKSIILTSLHNSLNSSMS